VLSTRLISADKSTLCHSGAQASSRPDPSVALRAMEGKLITVNDWDAPLLVIRNRQPISSPALVPAEVGNWDLRGRCTPFPLAKSDRILEPLRVRRHHDYVIEHGG
jgi:hypothetical protein